MAKYSRFLLAAFVLLLALPLSAQLDRVANTGGTSTERTRATATKPANRATRTRATANRPTDRRQPRTAPTRTNRNPNYCPPRGQRSTPRPATAPRRNTGTRARANDGFRWGTRSTAPRVSPRTTTPRRQPATASGVSTSILLGRSGQDVGRARGND